MRSDIALFYSLMEHNLPVCEDMRSYVSQNLNRDETNNNYCPPPPLQISRSPNFREVNSAYQEARRANILPGLQHRVQIYQGMYTTSWFIVRSADAYFCVKIERTGESDADLTIVDAQTIVG